MSLSGTRTGSQLEANYLLTEEELNLGYVRPLRKEYRHDRCGEITSVSLMVAEVLASYPRYYASVLCSTCAVQMPVREFRWTEDGHRVGS